MDTILVTGGTGVLGRSVVRRLADAGRSVRVLSRKAQPVPGMPEGVQWAVGDLVQGTGLPAALAGVGTVVHCASDPRRGRSDVGAALQLVEAAQAAGREEGARPPHVVYISIVGIEDVPFGYYRSKMQVEKVLRVSGLPWTVLRTTQFHDLVLAVAQQLVRPPAALVPSGVRLQPVDSGEVADRLAELATGEAAGRVPDMGGPRVWTVEELVRAVLKAAGRRRPVVSVPVRGALFAALRAGALLTPDHAVGRRGFEEFLAMAPVRDRRYGAAQHPGHAAR